MSTPSPAGTEDAAGDIHNNDDSRVASPTESAYPYHSPRLSPSRQADVPRTLEPDRQRQNCPHEKPTAVWSCDRLASGRVEQFMELARKRASFHIDDEALLSLVHSKQYQLDAALKSIPSARPPVVDDDGRTQLGWGNTWMRKMIECGGNLAELEAGLKILQDTKSASRNVVDQLLVRRCQELRNRAMEFNVLMRDASTNTSQPLGIGRLRNMIQNYTQAGSALDTPALQTACSALHAAKLVRRRLNVCPDLLQSQGHCMSQDEALRLQGLIRDRASFVSIPNIAQLDSAIQMTKQIMWNAEREGISIETLITPLAVPKAAIKADKKHPKAKAVPKSTPITTIPPKTPVLSSTTPKLVSVPSKPAAEPPVAVDSSPLPSFARSAPQAAATNLTKAAPSFFDAPRPTTTPITEVGKARLRAFDAAIRRRGGSRLGHVALKQLADDLGPDGDAIAGPILHKIEQQKKHLLDVFRMRGHELTPDQCRDLLQDCSENICCITVEEEAVRNLVKNTERFLSQLKDLHTGYLQNKAVTGVQIEHLSNILNSKSIARLPWSGDDRTCPVTWLRQIRQFAIWVEDRATNHQPLTPHVATELLNRMRVARVVLPQVKRRLQAVVAAATTTQHKPQPPSPAPTAVVQAQAVQTSGPDAMPSTTEAVANQLKRTVHSKTTRPTIDTLQSLIASPALRLAAPSDATFADDLSRARHAIFVGKCWNERAQHLLCKVQNDDEIKKHIADAKTLPVDLSDSVKTLEDRLWENNWLSRVVACTDLVSQIRLYREVEPRSTSRIQHTITILRQHLSASLKWLESVNALLGPYFLDDNRFETSSLLMLSSSKSKKPPSASSQASSTPTRSVECMCRRFSSPPSPLIFCASCKSTFHRSCLGFAPASAVQAPENERFFCLGCSRRQAIAYKFAPLYPPSDDGLELPGPRGPSLNEVLALAKAQPPKLAAPQKDAFQALLHRATSWAQMVTTAMADPNATVEHLQDLYLDGEDIRIDLPERRRLADRIRSLWIAASVPSMPIMSSTADVKTTPSPSPQPARVVSEEDSSESSSTVSMARQTDPSSMVHATGPTPTTSA